MRISYVSGGGSHGDRGHIAVSIASDVGSCLGMWRAGYIQQIAGTECFRIVDDKCFTGNAAEGPSLPLYRASSVAEFAPEVQQ